MTSPGGRVTTAVLAAARRLWHDSRSMSGRDGSPRMARARIPHWWIYPVALICVWTIWAALLSAYEAWPLYATRWPMALTMVFGSFVAGSTPAGGAAVAYPVFTKLLAIPSHEAALFGLMIQAVGMTMATLFIVTRNIRFEPTALRNSLIGAFPGVMLGLAFLRLPAHVPRLGFSCLLLVFAIVLYRSHWRHERITRIELELNQADKARFALTGFVGGLIASTMGSGADMLCFMVMTLGYGLDERVAVPTSVMVMAAVSLVGFGFRLLLPQPIGVVWEYWAVAAPVVAIGAPLGAWVASKINASLILALVFVLVSIEVVSTALLVPLDGARALWLLGVAGVAALWFWRLRQVRRRTLTAA